MPLTRPAPLDAHRLIVGELMERVTGTSPDQFHGAMLDWLTASVGCDSSLFMPAPDRKIRPVERNKGPFVEQFLREAKRYQTCLKKTAGALERDRLFVDVDVYSADERRNLPFYAEVIRPQGISSQLVIGIWFHQRYRGTLHLCRHGAVSPFCASVIRHVMATIPAIALIDAAAATTPAPSARDDLGLGAREREVAELAGRGLQTKEIAALLGIRPTTVRNQLHAIFRKLEVSTRAELAFVMAAAAG